MNDKDNFQMLREERTKLVNRIADLETENTKLREAGKARQEPTIEIIMPRWYEDDEPCGWCNRKIGTPHHSSCRQ